MTFTVHRLPDNPIITPASEPSIGGNINGPSLIRTPDWLPKPLGKYYLYFAHHQGTFIRMAYADKLDGPWTVYKPGVLAVEETGCIEHIASPEVVVNHAARTIEMYYHGPVPIDQRDAWRRNLPRNFPFGPQQATRFATSADGIQFTDGNAFILPPYTRVFDYEKYRYQMTMPGMFYRSKNPAGPYEFGVKLFTHMVRHSALWLDGDTLHLFFSRAHDKPERILHSTIDLRPDWNEWRATEPTTLLEPQEPWEGVGEPLETSHRGSVHHFVRQLRDPGIYEEDGKLYLLYAVGGESGLAIAELRRA